MPSDGAVGAEQVGEQHVAVVGVVVVAGHDAAIGRQRREGAVLVTVGLEDALVLQVGLAAHRRQSLHADRLEAVGRVGAPASGAFEVEAGNWPR